MRGRHRKRYGRVPVMSSHVEDRLPSLRRLIATIRQSDQCSVVSDQKQAAAERRARQPDFFFGNSEEAR